MSKKKRPKRAKASMIAGHPGHTHAGLREVSPELREIMIRVYKHLERSPRGTHVHIGGECPDCDSDLRLWLDPDTGQIRAYLGHDSICPHLLDLLVRV